MSLAEIATEQLKESAATIEATTLLVPHIVNAALLLVTCFKNKKKVILFGNGGSAADAQHIAAEFVGVLRRSNPRSPLNAISLATNASVLTAIVNDVGGDEVFSRQLEACAHPWDIAIGISTSGNSENILRTLKKAKDIGLRTIGLLGGTGGSIASEVDIAIIVPSKDTPRIQEAHITIGHIICDLVERKLGEEGFLNAGT